MQEALQTLLVGEDHNVQIDDSEADIREERTITYFLEKGCGCKWGCHTKLGRQAIRERRASSAGLSKT